MDELVSILYLSIAFTLLVGITACILYLVYLPFKIWLRRTERMSRSTSNVINKAYFAFTLLTIVCIVYIAQYPDESFYEEEFETVTFRKLPSSAEFIEKNASYPFFQGNYCSSAQIKLSKADYLELLFSLKNDHRMKKDGNRTSFYESDKSLDGKSTDKINHRFQREVSTLDYYCIEFYNDKHTIFVNLCSN